MNLKVDPKESDRFLILSNLCEMQFDKGFGRRYFLFSALNLILAASTSLFILAQYLLNSISFKVHSFIIPDKIIYQSVKIAFLGMTLGIFKLLISFVVDPFIVLFEAFEKWRFPKGKTALLIIDAQKDFTKAGSQVIDGIQYNYEEGNLGVADGFSIVPVINELLERQNLSDLVIASLDWHPVSHKSFASSTKGTTPYIDKILLSGEEQILWPDHCIQESVGAEFLPGLKVNHVQFIVKKGKELFIDSYSAFFDNGRKNKTVLDEYLKSKNVKKLILTGLATEYCVKYTAFDALQLGYDVTLVLETVRGVNAKDSIEAIKMMQSMMQSKGVKIMTCQEVQCFS